MSVSTGLRIIVADLLRRPGAQRAVHIDAPLDDLAAGPIAVPPDAPVHVDATLERIPEGIVVRGEVDVVWAAECSRCLRPLRGSIEVGIDELFEPHPIDGETYLLDHDSIDLDQVVRDAVLLELPPAPLLPGGLPRAVPALRRRPERHRMRMRRGGRRPPVGGAPLARAVNLLTPVASALHHYPSLTQSLDHTGVSVGRPQAQDEPVRHPVPAVGELPHRAGGALALSQLRGFPTAPHGLRQLRLVPRAPGRRGRVIG